MQLETAHCLKNLIHVEVDKDEQQAYKRYVD